jgi:hypothetical protein
MATKKSKPADLTIRLTDADRHAIEAAAKADHLPASTWLRQAALRLADERRAAKLRRARLTALAAKMRRLPKFRRNDAG